MSEYENVIIGAGISGCSLAYFMQETNTLLIDRNEDVAFGASGAAGAFLSPLLGKDNKFKSLISDALKFSVKFYEERFPLFIDRSGTCRIPKNNEDEIKFKSYEGHFDFKYKKKTEGYFFDIGSRVDAYEICKSLSENVQKRFDYEVCDLKYEDKFWFINNEIKTKNIFITTGCDTSLIKEEYFKIRAVWGQKIDINTTTCISFNYHKECSLAKTQKNENKNTFKTSIGATHRRFDCDAHICNHCLKTANINKIYTSGYTKSIINKDTQELLSKANNIMSLDNVEVTNIKVGARACSLDYFPMVGELVDSDKTIKEFPHLKNGTHVNESRYTLFPNLYVLNGVGGRGFVLAPYLAKQLVEYVKNNKNISQDILVNRLFKRWVRKQK